MPGKHGPNRLRNYIEVHEKWMGGFLDEGFVVEDRCMFTVHPDLVLLAGEIICLSSITIQVDKQLRVLDRRSADPRVQTHSFRYHAWVRGTHNILRYESAHVHRPQPHKHVYNTFGDGRESVVIDLFTDQAIPTLGEVIRELQEWHAENVGRLEALR